MKVRGKRILLNPPGTQSTAAIVAEVEDTRRWKPGCDDKGKLINPDEEWNGGEPTITVQLSDCSRSINLAFGGWNTLEGRKADLLKADRMIESLTVFRAALEDEQQLYLQRCSHARKEKIEAEA